MSTKQMTDLTADWPTYYGIKLTDVGEDGAILILGHQPGQTRRMIAALNRHARMFWGIRNLCDDRTVTYADARRDLCRRWARFVEPDPGEEWRVLWSAKPEDVGVFAVTMWLP